MIPPLPDKPSFTLEEAAQLTGFPKSTLQYACRKGKVAHQHLGRQRTFTRDQVIALFETTAVEPGSVPDTREPTPQQQRDNAARNRALARIGRAP